MNYATIRDQIYTRLSGTSGIGKIFKRQRYTADWGAFLTRFASVNPLDATKRIINVLFITRLSGNEPPTMDEDEVLTMVLRSERWQITLLYGFDDSDDDAVASETGFNTLCDAIQTRFRFYDQLGIPATVHRSSPLTMVSEDVRSFGEVLCHTAIFEIEVTQRIVS